MPFCLKVKHNDNEDCTLLKWTILQGSCFCSSSSIGEPSCEIKTAEGEDSELWPQVSHLLAIRAPREVSGGAGLPASVQRVLRWDAAPSTGVSLRCGGSTHFLIKNSYLNPSFADFFFEVILCCWLWCSKIKQRGFTVVITSFSEGWCYTSTERWKKSPTFPWSLYNNCFANWKHQKSPTTHLWFHYDVAKIFSNCLLWERC